MKFAYLIEPPFNFRDADGDISGCDVELARRFCEVSGNMPFEPIETEFAELLPGVDDGRWHMTTGLFNTAERRKSALFSLPIWGLPDGFLVKPGNPLSLSGYRSLATHPEATLAVIRDQFQHRSAIEFGVPTERIEVFETYAQAADAVSSGKVDAYASVARAHTGFIARNPDMAVDVVAVPADEKPPAFGCFAFSPDNHELCNAVNEFLRQFLGSSDHRQIMAGFGFNDAEIDLVAN